MVKNSQLIWQTHIIFQRSFGCVTSVQFQASMMKKLRYKYYNKRITTRDNGNVQSYDWGESKLNNIIIANTSAPQLQMTE